MLDNENQISYYSNKMSGRTKTLEEIKKDFKLIVSKNERFQKEVLDRCEVIKYFPKKEFGGKIQPAYIVLQRDDGISAEIIWGQIKRAKNIPEEFLAQKKTLCEIQEEFKNIKTENILFQSEVLDRCKIISYTPKVKKSNKTKGPTVILRRDDGFEAKVRWDTLKKGAIPLRFISESDRNKKTLSDAQKDFANIMPKSEHFKKEVLDRCKVIEYIPRKKENGKSILPQVVLERDDGVTATVFFNNLKKGMFPEKLPPKEKTLEEIQCEFYNIKTDKLLFKKEVLDRCEVEKYLPGTKTKHPKIILRRDDGKKATVLWSSVKDGHHIPDKFRKRSSWNIKPLKDIQKEFKNIKYDNFLFKEKVLDVCKVVKYIPYSKKDGVVTDPKVILQRNDGLPEVEVLWNELKRGRTPLKLNPKEKTLEEIREEFKNFKPRSKKFKQEVLDRCEVVEYFPFTKEGDFITSARITLRRDDGVEASLIWANFKVSHCIPSNFGFSNPLTNNEPGILYHIICKKHGVICQKIGVTRHNVSVRYSNQRIDVIKVLSETSFESGLFDQEKLVKQQMKEKFGHPIFGNEYFSLAPVLNNK